MNAPNFEAVTARAGHECRGGLLVGLGNKIPKSEFVKMLHLGDRSARRINPTGARNAGFETVARRTRERA
jgi:hypothetical protein